MYKEIILNPRQEAAIVDSSHALRGNEWIGTIHENHQLTGYFGTRINNYPSRDTVRGRIVLAAESSNTLLEKFWEFFSELESGTEFPEVDGGDDWYTVASIERLNFSPVPPSLWEYGKGEAIGSMIRIVQSYDAERVGGTLWRAEYPSNERDRWFVNSEGFSALQAGGYIDPLSRFEDL